MVEGIVRTVGAEGLREVDRYHICTHYAVEVTDIVKEKAYEP